MECVQLDLNNVCRTCKNEWPEMKSLYYRDSECGKENPPVVEMVMACASIQVNSDDDLPKVICRPCYMQLKNAYTFKEQCEKTDAFWREYLNNLKKANIKEETVVADLEYSSNFIDCISSDQVAANNDKNIFEEIKKDPEIHSQQVSEKDMDYVQVIMDNVIIYKCRTCSKDFYTLEDLRVHKQIHSAKTFNCKQCNKSFSRSTYLHKHELLHAMTKVHVCKICNKTLTRFGNLKKHLMTHLKDKPYICSKCDRGFNRVQHLENHVIRCKGDKAYVCDICNKAFKRQDSMEVHRKLHHNKFPVIKTLENLDNISEHYTEIDYDEKIMFTDEEEEDMGIKEENIEPEVEVLENHDQEKIDEIAQLTSENYVEEDSPDMLIEKGKIKEEICRESDNGDIEADNCNVFNSDNSTYSECLPVKQVSPKIKRSKGRPSKHSVPYKSIGKPRISPSLKHRVKADSKSENSHFECPQCKMVFVNLNMLERHTEQHGSLKLHKCDSCNKKFNRLNSLKRHKLLHMKTKPFVCVTCRKWFSRREHLRKHMKLHDSSEVHSCDMCQAVFHKAQNLIKHKAHKHSVGEKTATAEKKYECKYCSETFTVEKNRDSHMKVHIGDMNHQCKTCEKTFISKSHLTEHMKFHNDSSKNFLCSECGQRFSRNDYLVMHMRRHRGEKPFKCKFCGKGFPRTTDLAVHERCHTGEKTHLCVVCGRGFGRAYKLTVHMRTHTGEKPYRCTYCDAAFAQGNDLKTHIRRHTGERFQCDMCPKKFLMGYLLTQHKRVVHGLDIVSNIRRLKPANEINPDDPPPIIVPLPAPVIVSTAVCGDPLQIKKTEIPELKQQ